MMCFLRLPRFASGLRRSNGTVTSTIVTVTECRDSPANGDGHHWRMAPGLGSSGSEALAAYDIAAQARRRSDLRHAGPGPLAPRAALPAKSVPAQYWCQKNLKRVLWSFHGNIGGDCGISDNGKLHFKVNAALLRHVFYAERGHAAAVGNG